MDVQMPTMDGLEATRQIREYEQRQNIRPALIMALTGLTADEDHQEAADSGVDRILEKPVRLKLLGQMLDEWKAEKWQ